MTEYTHQRPASGGAVRLLIALCLTFVMMFVVNTVLSQMYTVLVPAVGTY